MLFPMHFKQTRHTHSSNLVEMTTNISPLLSLSSNPCCISGGQTRPCYTVKLLTETLSLKLKYHSLFLYFLCFLTPQNIRKIVSLQISTNPRRIKTTNRGVLTSHNLSKLESEDYPQMPAKYSLIHFSFQHSQLYLRSFSHFPLSQLTLTQVTRLVLMLRTRPGVALCFLTITHVCDSGLGSSDLSSPGVVTALHQPLS